MKIRVLFLVFIIITAAGAVFAQSKTVTNDDLSKYKQERVKAEAELRNNYALSLIHISEPTRPY